MNPNPTSPSSSSCPRCGAALPANAPQGLCPSCLINLAAVLTEADTLALQPRPDLPSLTEVAAAFPDLEILELIGQGGMSVVYRARQPRLDRDVALKILPKTLEAIPGFRERFSREGRVLARLNHPNIVTVHDFGESGGFYFLLMEFVDGVNLRQAMRAGRFTPDQALTVVPSICEALQFAHSQGVLHRDIKPENILLDSKGRVKIADFGIAKILGDGNDAATLTRSGAALGTAAYMAPEQIEKPATVDHRADIYSLGVVLYELLTGELPLGRFAAPSEKSIVGSQIDALVLRALEKERERRQQSAGEMKTQIEGLAGQWTASPVPAAPGRLESFEYKSKRTLFGLPLLHVTAGSDPATGRKRVARGVFAFGDVAIGIVACGGYARGLVALGGVSAGVVAIGGISFGLLSWGGLALALFLAAGGLALAPLATGGLAIGWNAMGGLAAGWHGVGGTVYAHYGMGDTVHAAHVVKGIAEMPVLLQWLVKATPWTMMGTFLWLPLWLPMLLVPWWARRQVQRATSPVSLFEKAAQAKYDARLFWLVPAAFGIGLLATLIISSWISAEPTPNEAFMLVFVVPLVISLVGLLVIIVSIPLMLRLVPMNSFYGLRLAATFKSSERWYDINARSARLMAGWAMVIIGAGIAGFFVLPGYREGYSTAIVGMVLLCLFFPLGQILWWLRRLPESGPVPPMRPLDFLWGKVLAAIPIASFVKTFIVATFTAAGSSLAPEVPTHSWLLVWKLVPRFHAGDFITYDNNGQTYLGRVTKVEKTQIWITRNKTPEQAVDIKAVTGRLVMQSRPQTP